MSSIKYTEDHEWIRPEDDGTLTLGITHFAQEQLGDIVFVELPDIGREISAGDEAAVIESVKTAADIKMPVSGEVVAVNERLTDTPEIVNQDPMQSGWFIRVRPNVGADLTALLDESAYEKLTSS